MTLFGNLPQVQEHLVGLETGRARGAKAQDVSSLIEIQTGIPIGNGILTTDTEDQARVRGDTNGSEAARAALELANLLDAIDED